jgi:hypothetical protein
MTITLTQTEAKGLLQRQFSDIHGPSVKIEIIVDPDFAERLKQIVNAEGGIDVPSNKIPRIKVLREAVTRIPELNHPNYMGLADAKYAIENWKRFLKYVQTHGDLPAEGFSGYGLA